MASHLDLLAALSSERVLADPIVVDIDALRQAHTAKAMTRDPADITDIADELDDLTEFSLLSRYARRKS